MRRPNRNQIELRPSDLESLLSEDHPARLVWGYVERQDLSPLYTGIKAVDGACGRSAIAPEILLALWRCMRRWRASAARGRWHGCAKRMMPIAGCAAEYR